MEINKNYKSEFQQSLSHYQLEPWNLAEQKYAKSRCFPQSYEKLCIQDNEFGSHSNNYSNTCKSHQIGYEVNIMLY